MSGELVPYRPTELIRRAKDDKVITEAEFKIIEPAMKDQEPSSYMPETSDVILVGILIDDSASIEEFGNAKAVRNGHNSIIQSLKESRESEKILFRTQYMKEQGALNNWVPLDKAKPMNEENYQPDGDTPLYSASVEIIGSAQAERKRALVANKKARFGVLIVSDGENTVEGRNTAEDVKTLVKGILSSNDSKSPNTLAFMGMPNSRVNYREIANSMGIEDQRTNRREEKITQILTPDSDTKSIRRAFDTFSRSISIR